MQPNACTIRKVNEDMTQDPERSRRSDLPPEVLEIILPGLQVGGASGISGMLVGGLAGIIRSSTPTLFAIASGIQWFTLGSTFWASRGVIIHAWGNDEVTPADRISASAIAGAIAGSVGGLLRGRRNVAPGAFMFTLFGAAGQVIYNKAEAHHTVLGEGPDISKRNNWLNSRWSPMKVLSDREYKDMLQEKLLHVNAEIAVVDDSLGVLRAKERERSAKNNAVKSELETPGAE